MKSPYGGYPVYYYTSTGKKALFPNELTYKTWYSDFNGVKVISQIELEAIPLADKNITVRPGNSVIRFELDRTLYVVEKGGSIRAITDAVARELYGATMWYLYIEAAFRANYTTGMPATTAALYNRTAALNASPSIAVDAGL